MCLTKSFSNFLLNTCSLMLHSLKINKTKEAPEYVYAIRSLTKKSSLSVLCTQSTFIIKSTSSVPDSMQYLLS